MKMLFKSEAGIGNLSDAIITNLDATGRIGEVKERYSACIRSIMSEDTVTFHVLAVPEGNFARHIIAAAAHPDLAANIATVSGRDVGDLDCVVLLGKDFIAAELSHAEMTEIAAVDVAEFLNSLWPAVDDQAGWVGPHLSWASIAGVIVSGLEETQDPEIMDRVCGQAVDGMINERYEGPDAPEKFCRENEEAIYAVDNIATECRKARGGGLAFPASANAIASAGRRLAGAALMPIAFPATTIH